MKRLTIMMVAAVVAYFVTMAIYTASQPTPIVEPVVPPAAPEAPVQVTKFAVGDEVIITFLDGTTADGTIMDVGPIGMWRMDSTGEEIPSRIYLVLATIDGITGLGEIPEFALTLKR